MSTAEPASPSIPAQSQEVKVVSHSGLFYWWPVWAFGFLFAMLSYASGARLAVVPEGTRVAAHDERHYDLALTHPPSRSLDKAVKAGPDQPAFPLHIAQNPNYGVLFFVVILLVIFITNVPLRGLWSVLAIMLIVLVATLLALFDAWEPILEALGRLHIYITVAGYMFMSVVLFLLWLVVLLFFDPRRYMVFSPGQLRVHQDIGGGEQVYDTSGLTFRKRRSDLFRHWVLGLGSGDLVVNIGGAQPQHFEVLNVLFVGQKEQQIAEVMKTRPVVPGQG
jgi:hypothetical protein